jgi:purine-nucleoside phosphorylase
MPTHLRPTAPIAPDVVLVGDPGRALLLAQELLEEPKMSNHARGLWGYSGETGGGNQLTIQSTGIGGPSATTVLAELSELGVLRAVRVGTCVGVAGRCNPGDLLVVGEAIAAGGSASSFGISGGALVRPNLGLAAHLEEELGSEGEVATVVSFDVDPSDQAAPRDARAADMQTAPLLAQADSLGIEAAAVLVVAEIGSGGEHLAKEALEEGEKRAGRAAAAILST